ncbi:MAG: DUF2752 domain-containing protein [Holophagaceae bacterium]|nr:DUF2752 domain-containing protein [Holophagaceae bacterium]
MPSLEAHRAKGGFRFSDGAVLLSLASLAILVASFALPAGGFPGIDTCAFHSLTGLPCPSCGLTRAFCSISHGHFRDAWSFNPFSFPLYATVLAGVAAPALNRRFPAITGGKGTIVFRAGIIVLTTAMLVYGAWRAKEQFKASHLPINSQTLPMAGR